MKKNLPVMAVLVVLFTSACAGNLSTPFQSEPSMDWTGWPEDRGAPLGSESFIQVDGQQLLTPEGTPFLIRGIAFGNLVWQNPSVPQFTHHGPEDYARVKALGFNSVRFYINYALFEDDKYPYQYKENGFTWLDRNIAAAREAGIFLVLNMHYPQGGFQSIGEGDALWNEKENQKRLAALWQEIARRYKDEQQILGYGLVNEPIPVKSLDQWKDLAQSLTDAIREVDPHHMIFVERAIRVESGSEDQGNLNFVTVDDVSNQVVYEFHFYDPMGFTHQNASWVPELVGHFSSYPDEEDRQISGSRQWQGQHTTKNLQAGDNRWYFYESPILTIEDGYYNLGVPAIQSGNLGRRGKVWFDKLAVEEFDPSGHSLGVVSSLEMDSTAGWYLWQDKDSTAGQAGLDDSEGFEGGSSLWMGGSESHNVYSSGSEAIPLTPGYGYKISGWIKGRNLPSGGYGSIKLDLYSFEGVINHRNKDYLKWELERYLEFGRAANVPLYLGEFGLIRFAFEENRGGEVWISDMLELLTEAGVSYNYHSYHETMFGLYLNTASELPRSEAINESLRDILKEFQVEGD